VIDNYPPVANLYYETKREFLAPIIAESFGPPRQTKTPPTTPKKIEIPPKKTEAPQQPITIRKNIEKAVVENKKPVGFLGFKGGFENNGKGTPIGDGKDKAMRKVANNFIGEIVNQNSSSATSKSEIGKSEKPKVTMLARNSELNNRPLQENTKKEILLAHKQGSSFVVGDMPGVDTPFIRYLNEIGANYSIYHTGDKPRVNFTYQATENKKPVTKNTGSKTVDVIKNQKQLPI
jgi:hypothetical protein